MVDYVKEFDKLQDVVDSIMVTYKLVGIDLGDPFIRENSFHVKNSYDEFVKNTTMQFDVIRFDNDVMRIGRSQRDKTQANFDSILKKHNMKFNISRSSYSTWFYYITIEDFEKQADAIKELMIETFRVKYGK